MSHSCINPCPTMLKISEYDVFLTITFKKRYGVSAKCQYEFTHTRVIRALKPSCEFICYPELTLVGAIHYHVMLKITNSFSWYSVTLKRLRLLGRCDIQRIKNWDDTYKYITKDVQLMEDLLKRNICITHESTPLLIDCNKELLDFFYPKCVECLKHPCWCHMEQKEEDNVLEEKTAVCSSKTLIIFD